MVFNTPKGRGGAGRGRGGSTRGTPIKRPIGQPVQTRSSKPNPEPVAPAATDETAVAQAAMLKWMKSMEGDLENAPSASAMEASWEEQFDTHLFSAEEKVRTETKSMEIVRSAPRLKSNFGIFAGLSDSDAKDDPKDVASTSGTIPKKKKDVPAKQPIIQEESDGSDDEEGAAGGKKEDENILIHEIDIGPMDLNEAQQAMMHSHLRDVIDLLLPSSPVITLEMEDGLFKMYRGITQNKDKVAPEPTREKRKPPPLQREDEKKVSIPYQKVFNSGLRSSSAGPNMIRVSVVMTPTRKKVIYVIPRADDGSPITALKNYMRSKGKVDWGLRNLDYGTAKIN